MIVTIVELMRLTNEVLRGEDERVLAHRAAAYRKIYGTPRRKPHLKKVDGIWQKHGPDGNVYYFPSLGERWPRR